MTKNNVFMFWSLLLLFSCGDSHSSYVPVNVEIGETEGYSIGFKSQNGAKTIHVKLNDVASFDALFDTGCSFDMVISLQEMQNLIKANTLSNHDVVGEVETTIANGESFRSKIINIKEVALIDKIGNMHKITNVRAVAMPNPTAPLLLGNGVIDKLAKSSFTVDLQKNEIRFN